ncbi:MAG: TldD/PmbA family protein, partial [Methanomicrobia archaeon]|nr:TldD/PmbA family protein [Methanomicrobia archaeon]
MEDAIKKGIERGEKLNADYCEIRVENIDLTYMSLTDGRIDTLNRRTELGAAIRILKDGAWGFVSCNLEEIGKGVNDAFS